MQIEPDHLRRLLGGWRDGPGPLAGRLTDRLVALADEGVLEVGTRVPPERTLASTLGVSRSTVSSAYRAAGEAGRLGRRQGSGHWIERPGDRPHGARTPNPMLRRLGTPEAGLIDLALAEPDVADATVEHLADLPPDAITRAMAGTGYHPAGWASLRRTLARWARRHDRALDADGIVVTTGAQQAIALAAQVFAAPGATVLVEDATFPGALETFRRQGLRVVGVPTDDEGPVPDALDEAARRHGAALAYLVPVLNNPTGVTTSARRLEAVAELAARLRLPVIDDRTPEPLAPPGRAPEPLRSLLPDGQVVTVGSMSKIAWAGLRVGWALTSPGRADDLVAARIGADLAGSMPSQVLAEHLVDRLDDLAATVRDELDRRGAAAEAALATRLPDWSVAPGTGAWRWIRLPSGDAEQVARHGLDHGVAVTAGPAFSPDGRHRDRLRLATVAPPDVVSDGVARLAAAWAAAGASSVRTGPAHRLVI